MKPLKRLLLAICRPFAKRREPPRIVATFRQRESDGRIVVSLEALGTFHAHEYELKGMACFLFALSRGMRARAEETGGQTPSFVKTADNAQTLACILAVEAMGDKA